MRLELICVATNDAAAAFPTKHERSGSPRSHTVSWLCGAALTNTPPAHFKAVQLLSAVISSSESSSCASWSSSESFSLPSSVTMYVSIVEDTLEQQKTCRGCRRATSQTVTSASPEPPITAMYLDFLPFGEYSGGKVSMRWIGKLDPRNFALFSEISKFKSHRSKIPFDVPTTAQPCDSSTASAVGIPCDRLHCTEKTGFMVRTSRPKSLDVGVVATRSGFSARQKNPSCSAYLSYLFGINLIATIGDSRLTASVDDPVTFISSRAESHSLSSPDSSLEMKNLWSGETSRPVIAALCSTSREINVPDTCDFSRVSGGSYAAAGPPNSL
ncbi:hypothetical protein OGATHE_001879 [Ogataea polymorpha]|uniref:Uncharacterized protein n=1 Tax=Ogataea polymorpha TaxID=460523 RepID=A0A9P8PM15_9ASCO|nr:hypothetical protein OGATHE_001879 [Ogataea polymorpha]